MVKVETAFGEIPLTLAGGKKVNIQWASHNIGRDVDKSSPARDRVIISFDLDTPEGRGRDRFRDVGKMLAGKGFASFVRVCGNGNDKSEFGPDGVRAVINHVLDGPGSFAEPRRTIWEVIGEQKGALRGRIELFLIGSSEVAGAVAAVAPEFEEVSKILLIAPDIKRSSIQLPKKGISEFGGEVAILVAQADENVLDSASKLASWASRVRTTVVAESDHYFLSPQGERALTWAPFWAFLSDEETIPASWNGLGRDDRGSVISRPLHPTRVAQLRAKIKDYEISVAPLRAQTKEYEDRLERLSGKNRRDQLEDILLAIARPKKLAAMNQMKRWAIRRTLENGFLTYDEISRKYGKSAPGDLESVFLTVAVQCSSQSFQLPEVDHLASPDTVGYLVTPTGDGSVKVELAERTGMKSFLPVAPVQHCFVFEKSAALGSGDTGPGRLDTAVSILADYLNQPRSDEGQLEGGISAAASVFASEVVALLASGKPGFLPVTEVQRFVQGYHDRKLVAQAPAEVDPITA